jgi:protein-L-isoaspartate(D-aspartate) O-methyltransferase
MLGMTDLDAQDFAALRARMVEEVDAMYADTRVETGLARMSPAVRGALGKVERHRLLPPDQARTAYRNHPLSIGHGQTISQPYIVALSTDLLELKPGDSVLDVGTARQVYSIELLEPLGRTAAARLADMGYRNIELRIGDGYQGWPDKAPFDAIVVTAAAPRIPPALLQQLKPGGRMVIPLGEEGGVQFLVQVRKRDDGGYDERRVLPVRFVPLVPRKS